MLLSLPPSFLRDGSCVDPPLCRETSQGIPGSRVIGPVCEGETDGKVAFSLSYLLTARNVNRIEGLGVIINKFAGANNWSHCADNTGLSVLV